MRIFLLSRSLNWIGGLSLLTSHMEYGLGLKLSKPSWRKTDRDKTSQIHGLIKAEISLMMGLLNGHSKLRAHSKFLSLIHELIFLMSSAKMVLCSLPCNHFIFMNKGYLDNFCVQILFGKDNQHIVRGHPRVSPSDLHDFKHHLEFWWSKIPNAVFIKLRDGRPLSLPSCTF